jgi:hypothetical protein
MADDIIKQASSKLLGWLLGIVATMMVAALWGGFTFYSEWKADEAAEEALGGFEKKSLMFDTSEQKEELKDHLKEAVPALEQRLKIERDKDFQKEVLNELKQMREIDTLNADQMYQIKEELRIMQEHH